MVCLHGFMDTWRTWELVLPRLERRHDVLALTLAGHAGGPALTMRSARPRSRAGRRRCTEDFKVLPWRPTRSCPPLRGAAASRSRPRSRLSTSRSELLAHQVRGVVACDALAMIDCARREGYDLDAQLVTCPVGELS